MPIKRHYHNMIKSPVLDARCCSRLPGLEWSCGADSFERELILSFGLVLSWYFSEHLIHYFLELFLSFYSALLMTHNMRNTRLSTVSYWPWQGLDLCCNPHNKFKDMGIFLHANKELLLYWHVPYKYSLNQLIYAFPRLRIKVIV